MAIKTRNPRLEDLFSTPQRRTFSVAGITVLLTILMIFVVIRPSIVRILTQISENAERKEVLSKMDTKFKNIQSLVQIEETQTEAVTFLNDEIIPDSRREDEFIANLTVGAERLNVKVLSMGVAEDTEFKMREIPDNVQTYIFTTTIQANSIGVGNFIRLLEDFPRPINIIEISMQQVGDEALLYVTPDQNLKVSIKAVVYFWRTQES
ncbi:hypothetical protein JW796_01770 [Candidatus Dojkabacteria bacterium]|nr:hypothetical protein [Candidatus Dojkabacteria bacterium]